MTLQLLWLCFAMCIITVLSEVQKDQPVVRVNKCCEPYELYIGKYCTHINKTNETLWHPFFTTEHGSTNIQVDYVYVSTFIHYINDIISNLQTGYRSTRLWIDATMGYFALYQFIGCVTSFTQWSFKALCIPFITW